MPARPRDSVVFPVATHRAAVELGSLHHRLLRGTPTPDWQDWARAHVSRIRAVRPDVVLPGQVVLTR